MVGVQFIMFSLWMTLRRDAFYISIRHAHSNIFEWASLLQNMSDEEVQTSEIEDVESDNSENNSDESDKEEEEGEVGEETDDVEMADPKEVEKKIEETRKAVSYCFEYRSY